MGVGRRRESLPTCQTSTEIYQAASATEELVVGSVCSLRLVLVLQPGSIAASTRRHRALVGQERRGVGWCGRRPSRWRWSSPHVARAWTVARRMSLVGNMSAFGTLTLGVRTAGV